MVELNYSTMHAYDSADYYIMPGVIIFKRRFKTLGNRINSNSEFLSHLEKTFLRPISKPINDTSVEQSRGGGSSIGEIGVVRVHGKDYV